MQLEEKKCREEVQKGNLRPLYFLYGEDLLKQELFLEQLLQKLKKTGGIERETYFGDEIKIEKFLDDANSLSLFQAKKLILVKQAESLSAKYGDTLRALVESLENKEAADIFVFCAKKADTRTKFIQAISKSKKCALVEMPEPPEWEFAHWASNFAHEEEKNISDEAKLLLWQWCGPFLGDLRSSIQKAALFAGSSETIEPEHVKQTAVRARPESVFVYTEAILERNLSQALSALDQLLEQGEESIPLLALVGRQYRWMLNILALKAEGKSEQQIAAQLRIFPAAAKFLFPAARRLGPYNILAALEKITDTELQLKSGGNMSGNSLYRLTLELCEQ